MLTVYAGCARCVLAVHAVLDATPERWQDERGGGRLNFGHVGVGATNHEHHAKAQPRRGKCVGAPDPEPDPDPCPDPPSHTTFLANTALMRASRHTVRRCGNPVLLQYNGQCNREIYIQCTVTILGSDGSTLAAHWQHIATIKQMMHFSAK